MVVVTRNTVLWVLFSKAAQSPVLLYHYCTAFGGLSETWLVSVITLGHCESALVCATLCRGYNGNEEGTKQIHLNKQYLEFLEFHSLPSQVV